VPAGEPFEPRQLEDIARATAGASQRSGLTFSVYVGQSEFAPATYVDRLLAASPDPVRGVVILVDPAARSVEVATGQDAAKRLDDRSCGLAALSMSSSFAGGDLVGGIVTGLRMLGDSVLV
jgi:hypothetical protein